MLALVLAALSASHAAPAPAPAPAACPAAGRPVAGKARLLTAGDFHGDEVAPDSAGEWLGLFAVGNRWLLEPVEVRVEPVEDPVIDADPSERTGRRVSVAGGREPVLLLRGAPGVVAGPVEGAAIEGRMLWPGEARGFEVGLSPTHLVAEGTVVDGDLPTIEDYSLRLVRRGVEQELARFDLLDDGAPAPIWVGDLDRDGEADLVLQLSGDANVSRVVLLLSSGAGPGQVVGLVAEHVATGC